MRGVAEQPLERRLYERVTLLQPLPGRVGTSRIFILELGVSGMSVAHRSALPRVGQVFQIEFAWEAKTLHFECEVVHNDLQKLAKSSDEKSTCRAL